MGPTLVLSQAAAAIVLAVGLAHGQEATRVGPVAVSGRITDPDGRPPTGVTVTAARRLPPLPTDPRGAVRTDSAVAGPVAPDGASWLTVLPGPYLLAVVPEEGSVWLPQQALVEVATDTTVAFTLQAGAHLRVQVVGPDGRPVPGAYVGLMAPTGGGTGWCCTGEDGVHQERVAPGQYELRVRATSRTWREASQPLRLAGDTTVTVSLERSGGLAATWVALLVGVAASVGWLARRRPAARTRPPVGWAFVAGWVAASMAGGAVGLGAVAPVAALLFLGLLGVDQAPESLLGALVLLGVGATVGLAQAAVLRRASWAFRTRGWTLASGAGWLGGEFLAMVLTGAPGRLLRPLGRWPELLLGALVAGLVVGAVQWLVLRHEVPRAGWWPVAGAVGSLGSALVLGPFVGRIPAPMTAGAVGLGAGVMAVAGAVTGVGLLWLSEGGTSCREDGSCG
ncbi:MAG: carboxypeptidase-like regulatory domain-containing protein [Candidatus Latescibacterota bacterium]